MKIQLTKLIIMLGVLVFTIKANAAERWETLRAINWVENPTNQTKVGKHGELGPYQFRPATWRMHTNMPFPLAVKKSNADEVAIKHYEWIKRTLERSGVEASAFNIAMAWNCGVSAVVAGRIPPVTFQYAQRVTNLIGSFNSPRREIAEQENSRPSDWSQTPSTLSDDTEGLRFRVLLDPPKFVIAG